MRGTPSLLTKIPPFLCLSQMTRALPKTELDKTSPQVLTVEPTLSFSSNLHPKTFSLTDTTHLQHPTSTVLVALPLAGPRGKKPGNLPRQEKKRKEKNVAQHIEKNRRTNRRRIEGTTWGKESNLAGMEKLREDESWGILLGEESDRRADRRDLEIGSGFGTSETRCSIFRFRIGPRRGAARLGYR